MPDHSIHLGHDDELEYLARRYDDGTVTISTRPLGGVRWSPEVPLAPESAKAVAS